MAVMVVGRKRKVDEWRAGNFDKHSHASDVVPARSNANVKAKSTHRIRRAKWKYIID